MIELTELSVTPLKYKRWKVNKDWNILIEGNNIIINKGFIFDFASVPRVFWIFFPPATGRYRKAALVHDWMYKTAYKNKKYADKTFLKIMGFCNVPLVKRYFMYFAVKLFGRGSYES